MLVLVLVLLVLLWPKPLSKSANCSVISGRSQTTRHKLLLSLHGFLPASHDAAPMYADQPVRQLVAPLQTSHRPHPHCPLRLLTWTHQRTNDQRMMPIPILLQETSLTYCKSLRWSCWYHDGSVDTDFCEIFNHYHYEVVFDNYHPIPLEIEVEYSTWLEIRKERGEKMCSWATLCNALLLPCCEREGRPWEGN